MKNYLIKTGIGLFLIIANLPSACAHIGKDTLTDRLQIRPFLHIGDKVPDEYYTAAHYKGNQLKLSDFKGKWIILDLWGVYCGSCIEHMPEVQQLQKEFKDSVQFIMVTKNTNEQVKKLAARSENVGNNHLPFITGEQKLAGLFDYTYLPTHVWIDGHGIIRYITGDEHTTRANIAACLQGRQLDLKEKPTIRIGTTDDPLLVQMYPYFKNDFYIYSYLAPRDDRNYIMGGFESDGLELNGNRKIAGGNAFTFKDLYKIAYGYSRLNNPLSDSRVFADFKDTSDYANPLKQYVYEIIVNKNIPEQRLRSYIKSQLDLFFNVNSSLQKRRVTCLVFKRLNNGLNCSTANATLERFHKHGDKLLEVTLPWEKFIKYMDNLYITPPFQIIDETGIPPQQKIDLEMSLDFNDLPKVQRSLAPFGLTLVQEAREKDCIIIAGAQ